MDLLKGLRCSFDGERLLITNIHSSDAETCSLDVYCSNCQSQTLLPKVAYEEVRKIFQVESKYFSNELTNKIQKVKGEK
jgi:hypothetical protein